MKLKWLIVFAVLVAGASAASLHHRRSGARDIPVQVVYDAPEAALAAVRNLDDKPQLPVEEKPAGVKNLEAKPQLSTAEVQDAVKHLPAPVDDANKVKIVTPDQVVEVIQPVQPVASAAYQQGEDQNIDDIYDKIQEIINNGAKKIQADFEKIPEDSHKQDVLKKVNCTLEEFLENTKKLIQLRNIQTLKQDASATTASPIPNPANIFQQIISSFQTFSSNLFSGLNPAGQPGQAQSEGTTAAPGGFPNPIEVAQGIFSQLQGNLGSLFGARPPAAQSDETPATQGSQNPLQFIQQQFSNIFQRPTAAPGNQADEQTPNNNPIVGFVQGAISNVQNVFNPSTATPAAHDEVAQGTTAAPGNPLQFFQNAGQNVISAIQNNPFFPGGSSTAAPETLANAAATTAAPNPAAAAIANAQNQFAQAIPNNPFQQPAQQAIAAGTSQANQVVAQLTQQGVPVPEQVNTAINAAQQVAGEAATTAKPVDAATSAPAPVEAPAAPEAVETPASDDVAEEVPADEVKEEPTPVEPEIVTPIKEETLTSIKEEISTPIKEEPVPVKVEESVAEEISNEVSVSI